MHTSSSGNFFCGPGEIVRKHDVHTSDAETHVERFVEKRHRTIKNFNFVCITQNENLS